MIIDKIIFGPIVDVELPLMGKGQVLMNFNSRVNPDYSQTLAIMLGSVRPKIYSIRKMLLSNTELCEKSKGHYKVLLHDLPVEDSITFCIADQFFRFMQGQMWSEVLFYLRRLGVNPLGGDGEMLLMMRQRDRACALYVQERQAKLLKDVKRKELIREREEIIKIRDANLPAVMAKIQEIHYIRRTTDQQYRQRKKKEQTQQIKEALCFPINADTEHCQRTFHETWNVTVQRSFDFSL